MEKEYAGFNKHSNVLCTHLATVEEMYWINFATVLVLNLFNTCMGNLQIEDINIYEEHGGFVLYIWLNLSTTTSQTF